MFLRVVVLCCFAVLMQLPALFGQDTAKARGIVVRPAANPATLTATLAKDQAEIKLPGAADSTCYGGGGRYILFRIPKVKQVAVLDVCAGKIVKYLPLAEANAQITAGNEHLFVLNPTANVIQRWSLTTLKKEVTVQNPFSGVATCIVMGHATDGPLLVVGPNKFLDGATLKELQLNSEQEERTLARLTGHPQYWSSVRISGDGRVLAWYSPAVSPSGLSSLVLGEGEPKYYSEHTTVGAIIPGPTGTLFTAGGLYTPELKLIGKEKRYQYWHHAPIPAAHGDFYLSVSAAEMPRGKSPSKLSLSLLGEESAILELDHLEGLDIPKDHNQTMARGLQLHDRVFLVPDANVLAVLTGTADKVIMHKFDLEALLTQADIDYLFITSQPPAAVRGTTFNYTPAIKSRKGGVKVKFDAGPEGMKVTKDKSLRWVVPKDFAEASVSVVLTISDKSGQEKFHTFNLPVTNMSEKP